MDTQCEHWERRCAERHAMAGKLWYLADGDEDFIQGWTTDRSLSGIAFVARAGKHIAAGDRIDVAHTDPRDNLPDCESLRVCRVEPYGPALQLIACTRFG